MGQDKCLDVTGDVHDGHRVRVWSCKDKLREATMSFSAKEKAGLHPLESPDPDVVPETVPVDCVWGPWLDWSTCSQSCDSGTRFRSRVYAEDAAHGGKDCEGHGTDERPCNTAACPTTTTTLESLVAEIRAQRQEMISEDETKDHRKAKSGSIRQHKGLHMLQCGLMLLSALGL